MKGRGIDFEHKFNTSRWAEDLLIKSLSLHHDFIALRFGLSRVVVQEKLVYGGMSFKEPDIIVVRRSDLTGSEVAFLPKDLDLSGIDRARFEQGADFAFIIKKAVGAIEVEFSPYKAAEMKGRNWVARTSEQWDKKPLKHAKPPTAPNIWVKEEDLAKLADWQKRFKTSILVVHVFDQEAFAIPLNTVSAFSEEFSRHPDSAKKLQMTSGIFKIEQTYDRVDAQGAREKKTAFVVTPFVSQKVGDIVGVQVKAQIGLSTSKKYVSHVVFSDGKLAFMDSFLTWLENLRK